LATPAEKQSFGQKQQPRGEVLTLVLECALYGLCAIVLVQALDYYWQDTRKSMPTLLWLFRTMQLYLHEGGHFISSPFGETLMILGGSFWQIMLPMALFLFTLRDRMRIGSFALFFTGLCTMDVSYYARDAFFRIQPLIGGAHKNMHDWFRLAVRWGLDMDDIAFIADALYYVGALFSLLGVGAGLFLAARSYLKPTAEATGKFSVAVGAAVAKSQNSSLNAQTKKLKTENLPSKSPPSDSDDPWGMSHHHSNPAA
jgi:hypothetical protein